MDTSRQHLTNKTLNEWIDIYNKKVPERFERDKKFSLFYLPEKGFAEMVATDDILVINQLCGDFKFWRFFSELLAQKLGYKTVGTLCVRPIKAYIRLGGFSIERIEKTPQGERYFCIDKHTGQKGLASPVGRKTYCITVEVPIRETSI